MGRVGGTAGRLGFEPGSRFTLLTGGGLGERLPPELDSEDDRLLLRPDSLFPEDESGSRFIRFGGNNVPPAAELELLLNEDCLLGLCNGAELAPVATDEEPDGPGGEALLLRGIPSGVEDRDLELRESDSDEEYLLLRLLLFPPPPPLPGLLPLPPPPRRSLLLDLLLEDDRDDDLEDPEL